MSLSRQLILALVLWPLGLQAQGIFTVRFESPVYLVGPNEVVPIRILFDPPPSAGLFSYGVAVNFDSRNIAVQLANISAAPALNFNGVAGEGALRSVGDGFAGIKGTVDFSGSPVQVYPGSLLASFLLENVSGQPGDSVELTLDFFRTLGPTESIFVDGLGNSLDDRVVFSTALIRVIPEPSTYCLLATGLLALQSRRIRRWIGQSRNGNSGHSAESHFE